jgi:hypothetical protein
MGADDSVRTKLSGMGANASMSIDDLNLQMTVLHVGDANGTANSAKMSITPIED